MENTAHIDGNGNIIIQDVDGAIITVNPQNTGELRNLIIDIGTKLNELPKNILELIKNNQDIKSETAKGANLYLTVMVELHAEHQKLKFGLTITNLTKEHRYFNQPFFKVTPKIEILEGVEHDTFVMIPENDNNFPVRLEYGQVVSYNYNIKDGAYKMYKKMLDKDEKANIQAFTNTTVGELYESNQFSIEKLFEHLN